MKKAKKDNIFLDHTVSLLWYHIEDNSVTLHKSACYPDKIRKNVGIIYVDDYKGQEGLFVFGGLQTWIKDPNNREDLECLEFFDLNSEVSKEIICSHFLKKFDFFCFFLIANNNNSRKRQ